jgi:hypothetical protein
MLNELGKLFMQPRKVSLPWLSTYRCHTQLQARLWNYLRSYSKLVHILVWVLLVCYQKLKFLCIMIYRDEGTVVPIEMLSRVAGPIPWPGSLFDFTLLDIFWSNVTEHTYFQTFDILLTEGHSEIEHVWGPALFWDFTLHKFVIPFWYLG